MVPVFTAERTVIALGGLVGLLLMESLWPKENRLITARLFDWSFDLRTHRTKRP